MKNVLLVSLVILGVASLVIAQTCKPTTCKKRGEACQSQEICTTCSNGFSACAQAATDASARCGCFGAYWTCVQNAPQCYQSANSLFGSCAAITTGTDCTTNCTHSLTAPADNHLCTIPSDYCSSAGTCAARHPTGACTSDHECGSSDSLFAQYACVNSTCQRQPTSLPGDKCSTTSDCVGNRPCTNGRCEGIAKGASCSDSKHCAPGLYCDTTCVSIVAEGGDCVSTKTDQCEFGSVCGTTNKCVKFYSVADGQPCAIAQQHDDCGANSYCKLTSASTSTGTCTARPTTSVACNITAQGQCDAWGTNAECGCNMDGTTTCTVGSDAFIDSGCVGVYQNFVDCARAATECRTEGGFDFSTNSCLYEKCKNQINCVYDCSSLDALPCFEGLPNLECTGSSSIVTFGMMLFVTIAAFLF